MLVLQDNWGREFSYLRLSIIDLCNFRCDYCLPNGCINYTKLKLNLTLAEIKNLVIAFAELGISKIRITGGEPTLHKDIIKINVFFITSCLY